MARPREFDFDQALDRAMDVFWTRGYEGASLAHLLRAMGIARGSLYKAFKDKRSIYLAALDRYDRTVVQGGVDRLRDCGRGSGVERIRGFLRSAAEAIDADTQRRGCLLANAAVDRAPFDSEVATRVRAMLLRLEQAIAAALKEQDGLPVSDQPPEISRLIVNTYLGLQVLAKAGYPAEALMAIVESSLPALTTAEPS